MLPLSKMIKSPLFLVGTEDYACESMVAAVYTSVSLGRVYCLLIAGGEGGVFYYLFLPL